MAIRKRFHIPANADDFEILCLEILRRRWSRPGLDLFGKRGQRQYGIDILDLSGRLPLYAAQCKLKENHKPLRAIEIQREVDLAKTFAQPLGRYAILTTGSVSTESQQKAREINQAHIADGLFEVEILNWEHICSLLDEYEEVQEKVYGGIGSERAKRIDENILELKDGVQSLTSKSAATDIDIKINEARDCIARKDYPLATLLLNLIERTSSDLTPRQRFRVISNLGAAALGSGKLPEAARHFLAAAPTQPDDEQGQINEVFAYLLVGDVAICHQRAVKLRERFPSSGRLTALWIMTSPDGLRLTEIEQSVNSVLQSDPEVAVAMARRAMKEVDFEKALGHATRAVTVAPHWAQGYLAIAQSGLGRAVGLEVGQRLDRASHSEVLGRAEEACTQAIDVARKDNDLPSTVASLVQRAEVRLLRGQVEAATSDAEEVYRMDPDDPRVLLTLAQIRLAAGRADDGIVILGRANRLVARPDLGFMYGKALYDRGQEGDLDNSIRILRDISVVDFPQALRVGVAAQVLQCFVKKKDFAAAAAYLESVSSHLVPAAATIFRGNLAYFRNDLDEANGLASEAQSRVLSDASPDIKDYLARLLMLLGRPADALPLWQNVFESNLIDFDPGALLDCAARLHKDGLVIAICDELHNRGVVQWKLTEFEVQYLQKYNVEGAIERLKEFIATHPSHKLAKLRLSIIGCLLGRSELVSAGPNDLPTISELPIEYAIAAVQVMRVEGDRDAAVDYAYAYLKDHFSEMQAHQALIASMMPGLRSPSVPPTLELVGPGSAVCYREAPAAHRNWVVLEDTSYPSRDFEEIALSSSLAQSLMGRRVGDNVIIAKGHLHDRIATIEQIVPKQVRRYQDSMTEMQVRFGAASPVESVWFAEPDGAATHQGVELLLTSIKERAQAVEAVREVYRTQPVPLHFYGSRFGRNAYIATWDLAQDLGQQVKCSVGSSEEWTDATSSLRTATSVVIDMTALATLRILGLTKVLSSTRYRLVVSQDTLVTLREMLADAKVTSAEGGTLSYRNGRPEMLARTLDDERQRLREDEEFLRFIEKHTECRSGLQVAALEPERRDLLRTVFGQYGAESIIIASASDHVLWTDDLVQAQFAAQEFGVRRVWTQVMLASLADVGVISLEEYSEATARLTGMEYMATSIDASALLAGFRLSDWSPQKWPAAQFIKIFSDPLIAFETKCGLLVIFIEKLFREPVPAVQKCIVLQSLLDALGDRPEVVTYFENFRNLSGRVFGINGVGQHQFDVCIGSWLKHRGDRVIIPG